MEFIPCVLEAETTFRNQNLKTRDRNKSDPEGKKRKVQMEERNNPRNNDPVENSKMTNSTRV